MTPQLVQIHGTPCVLQRGGDVLNPYVIARRDTGAVITQQPTRFLAVARAALVLHNPQPHAEPVPPALPGVPNAAHGPALVPLACHRVRAADLPLHGLHPPAPAHERRLLREPGSADAAGAAVGGTGARPAGPARRRGVERAGQADEGVAV